MTNNKFYVYNSGTGDLMVSTNGGSTFIKAGNAGAGGSKIIRTVPGKAGHLWIAKNNGGLIRTNDGGITYTTPSAAVTAASAVGIGKAAPNAAYPTVYIWGTVSGVTGVFRSIDQGLTWERVNDDLHQYGGTGNGNFVVGDMNVYGRVYMSTVGRGIVYGDSDATLGLDDFGNSVADYGLEVIVKPNPVKEYLQIKLPDSTSDTAVIVTVYDVSGRVLLQNSFEVQNNTVSILLSGISNISKGICVVKVKTSQGIYSSKVLKQ